MPSKSSAESRIFISVQCPKCGTEGSIDASQMGSQFTCRRCRQSFHLEVTRAVRGKRQEIKLHDARNYKPADDRPSWLGAIFEKLPRSGKMAIGGATLIGALLLGLAYFYFAPSIATLPEGLEERAKLVGLAAVKGDASMIKALAMRESRHEAGNWVLKARNSKMPTRYPADQPPTVTVSILTRSPAEKNDPNYFALSTVRINVHLKFGATDEHDDYLTYWGQDRDLQWWMDIKRSSTAIVKR